MAVGPNDVIDRKLVQIYAKAKTNNFDMSSTVNPEKIMNSMELMALNNKSYFDIKRNIGNRKSNLKDAA